MYRLSFCHLFVFVCVLFGGRGGCYTLHNNKLVLIDLHSTGGTGRRELHVANTAELFMEEERKRRKTQMKFEEVRRCVTRGPWPQCGAALPVAAQCRRGLPAVAALAWPPVLAPIP